MTTGTQAPDPAQDLLPCPFCGGGAVFQTAETGDGEPAEYVTCTKCSASTALCYPCMGGPREHLALLWNRRAAIPAPEGDERIKALNAVIDLLDGKNRSSDRPSDYVFRAVAAARAALAAPAPQALDYAQRLASSMWEKHYKAEAPEWKPFGELLGVLTQIDNMLTGLARTPAPAPQDSLDSAQCSKGVARQAAPVALTDEQIGQVLTATPSSAEWFYSSFAHAAIAEFCRVNGIPAPQTKEPTNDR